MKQKELFGNKKCTLIALACAGMFVAPAAVNAQLVYNTEQTDPCGSGSCAMDFSGKGLTIQGSISLGVARTQATGAATGPAAVGAARTANTETVPRNQIWVGESNIRFSGSRKLGTGFVRATGFALEQGTNYDTGSTTSASGVFASRNSGAGIDTTIGSFWLGHWDTNFKTATTSMNVTPSPTGPGATNTAFVGGAGFGMTTASCGNAALSAACAAPAAGSTGAITNSMNFNRRQQNILNYLTPTYAGFQGAFDWSPNEETATNATNTVAGFTGSRPQLYGFRLSYTNGPLLVNASYEQHDDYMWGSQLGASAAPFGPGNGSGAVNFGGAGTAFSSKDKGYKLAGSYTFGKTYITVIGEKLKYHQDLVPGTAATVISNLERNMFYVGVKQQLVGPHELRGWYARAGSYSCTPNCPGSTGATGWTLVYLYSLDRYTKFNVSYARLNNDSNANYAQSTNGASSSGFGNTSSAYSVGIATSF